MFATCELKESKEIPEEALRNHHDCATKYMIAIVRVMITVRTMMITVATMMNDYDDDDENLASEILLNKLDRQGLRARACSKLKMMRRRG